MSKRTEQLLLLTCLGLLIPVPGTDEARAAPLKPVDSDLASLVHLFQEDLSGLHRRHDYPRGEERDTRLRSFYLDWQQKLEGLDFLALNPEGRLDWVLLRNRIESDLREMARREAGRSEIEALVPFAESLIGFEVARRSLESVDSAKVAEQLEDLRAQIESTQEALKSDEKKKATTPTLAHRAAKRIDAVQESLQSWFAFYDGYDPLFSWWVAEPYREIDEALTAYAEFLRSEIVGVKEGEDPPIVGDPVGKEALLGQLQAAMIPYSPDELQAIARREFAWCEEEMLKASRELGFGDDWHAALEHVKGLHAPPGKQPELIRDLALEAIAFMKERDLLTIPPIAEEIWRMEMMSPERQKVSPFFLGGETILVSFPTDTMAHEDKLMSLRGNNEHFARATVHHELIPGHHMQFFVIERTSPHRWNFSTPFWLEGWALYWEMRLWNMDFQRSPEDRIGMLFWRMHRCARILFSLGFHLGEMTPQECIDMLVDRVGHEPANATAEVRRSFEGSYGPLYQLAYMIGALQFRALHEELVVDGEMPEKFFHDKILAGGPMPVELVRKRLMEVSLEKDFRSQWRFEDPQSAPSSR